MLEGEVKKKKKKNIWSNSYPELLLFLYVYKYV